MIKNIDKNSIRVARHDRMRYKLNGTTEIPRLNVYRSLNHIYAQVIDDSKGVTLVSASTGEKEIASKVADMKKVDASKVVGGIVAERALAAGIKVVVYDRGGYKYTGRVAALADGAREAGLQF
jgi:large subunit ribosomal protein L18